MFLPMKSDWATATRRDLLAGLTVAIVALPLALGFGVASGLGAAAGLVTAIVAGAVAAVFGGSNLQVSGPTGAMTVVLVPIVAKYGHTGVLTVGLLAGLMLLALAFARAGRYVRYVPAPVIEGFTLGIAGVIALQQLPAALGTQVPGHHVTMNAVRAAAEFARHPHWQPIALATGVVVIVLVGGRWRPGIPFSLVAVVTMTLAATGMDVARIGILPSTLPAPSLAFLDLSTITSLLPSAVAVAALAALESLLCATVADAMHGKQRHNPDRELFGQGLANVVTPLFGGVPATAAIARTAVNVRTGASSRLAALTHAVVLALIVLAAAPLVAHIPLAVLAGVLIATAIRMVQFAAMRALMRGGKADALVFFLTAVTTLALDLVTAVIVGLVVASALALRAVARSVQVSRTVLDEHTVEFRLNGPLFFGAAQRLLFTLADVTHQRVIVCMSEVTTVDGTGAQMLRDAVDQLQGRGVEVEIAGVRPEHRNKLAVYGVPIPQPTVLA